MKRSANNRLLRSGGILLSSLYVFLLGAASFCMFAHASPQHGEQHHTQHEANHSTLCKWACQIASDSSASQISIQPTVNPILLASLSVFDPSTLTLEYTLATTRSRAPPHFLRTIS